MKKISILLFLLIVQLTFSVNAQNQYGDLELSILRDGNNPAPAIEVKAIDPDSSDTTTELTNAQGTAYFNDLYVYTITGIGEHEQKKSASLEGLVDIFNMNGQKVDQKTANNGTILWNNNNSIPPGVYIARDQNNTTIKFIYNKQATRIGEPINSNTSYSHKSTSALDDTTNLYDIQADGRFLEFGPFDVTTDTFRMHANTINTHTMTPATVPDAPATGYVQILINGIPCGDNSSVKLVRPGQIDTIPLTTTNGIADIDATDGMTSHPFGNFTRDYNILINSFNADSNWFHAQTVTEPIHLGTGNDITLNPQEISPQERTADISLNILLDNGLPATTGAQVKIYRPASTDTTFATTDADLVDVSRLVHPFKPDAHNITISSYLNEFNCFSPLTQSFDLTPGQNDITMTPTYLPDGPSSGQVNILVNGQPSGDNSSVKIVRTGTVDTLYFTTQNGTAIVNPADGMTSHPFGNFTRDYNILINSFDADSNWFYANTYPVQVALGSGNDFTFTPTKIPDNAREADVSLEVLVNGQPVDNASVKVYHDMQTDTTDYFTTNGIADFTRLVHPFKTDTHNITLTAYDVEFNCFSPLTQQHNLVIGQNNILMTPTYLPDGPASGQVDILVDGTTACADGASVKFVRPGAVDTIYTSTNNGTAIFTPNDGVTSHPYGIFTREYLVLISGNDFIADTNTVDIALGAGNNFTFTPNSPPQEYADGMVRAWKGMGLISNVNIDMWKLVNPTDTFTYVTNAAGAIFYNNIPVDGPTDYVFSSTKDDGVNPVLFSLDTATLVDGTNPLINIYLENILQEFYMTGTIREFYNQSQTVSGVGMLIRNAGTGATIDSTGTDANGVFEWHGVPADTETEVVMIGKSNHFNRIHNYTLPAIVQNYNDTIIDSINMLHVPFDFIIPQTANDPAPATLTAIPEEVAELVGYDEINGEEIARHENRIYLTNFTSPSDSAYFHAANNAIDSLFYGGQGSPLNLVSNYINITGTMAQNYDINNGVPGQLGWNVTRGSGNVTTPIYSGIANGYYYILGGQINITGDAVHIKSAIKELQGRRLQLGDVTSRLNSYMNINASYPDHKDRAYTSSILINQDARVMNATEIFPLNGLSTTLQAPFSTKQTYSCSKPSHFLQVP